MVAPWVPNGCCSYRWLRGPQYRQGLQVQSCAGNLGYSLVQLLDRFTSAEHVPCAFASALSTSLTSRVCSQPHRCIATSVSGLRMPGQACSCDCFHTVECIYTGLGGSCGQGCMKAVSTLSKFFAQGIGGAAYTVFLHVQQPVR